MVFTKFNLQLHVTALKKYLLLGQGDFVQLLLYRIRTFLNQRATRIYSHVCDDLLGIGFFFTRFAFFYSFLTFYSFFQLLVKKNEYHKRVLFQENE